MLTPETIATIIIQVTLVIVFVTVFFFTEGSRLEKEVVKDQIQYIADELTTDIQYIPPQFLPVIHSKLDAITLPDLSQADAQAKLNNDNLKKKVTYIMIGFVAVSFAVVFFMVRRYHLNVANLVKINALTIIPIIIVYWLFAAHIASRYRSGDPNVVKKAVAQTLHDHIISLQRQQTQ